MKPKYYALIWFGSFISYLIIVFLMDTLIPMGALLDWYNALFGQISGYEWDKLTGYLILLGGSVLNGLCIWLVAKIVIRRQKRG